MAWSLATVVSVLAVFVGDGVLLKHKTPPLLMVLLIDEPEHGITGLLLLGAFGFGLLRRYWVPTLAGSILIDADHLPQEFGKAVLIGDAPRPYTHSLATLMAVLFVTCWLSPRLRPYGFAVAFGLATHLFRDTTEGAVLLLWPLTRREFHLMYWPYGAALIAATGCWISHIIRARRRPTIAEKS